MSFPRHRKFGKHPNCSHVPGTVLVKSLAATLLVRATAEIPRRGIKRRWFSHSRRNLCHSLLLPYIPKLWPVTRKILYMQRRRDSIPPLFARKRGDGCPEGCHSYRGSTKGSYPPSHRTSRSVTCFLLDRPKSTNPGHR